MNDISRTLIIRAAEGDMGAFEEIYTAYASYVYTIAFRITGNREDADEAAQDVFLNVYRKLAGFGFRSSFKTWIYRITSNAAITIYRKRSKEKGRNISFDETIDSGHSIEPDIGGIDRQHDEKTVRGFLWRLPEDQRACLVLREIEGLKYEEIAQVLKIKINTVRSRLKRAREKLIAIAGSEGGAR
ncbi:MAG: sigma-70 family RNA polymerase sigma factor [Candidatus Tantalella remota]|nr:sigma-70 family RNA polymerase sigma factor [Candidatus Tantalella remota]